MLAPLLTLPWCRMGRKEPHHCLHQLSPAHSSAKSTLGTTMSTGAGYPPPFLARAGVSLIGGKEAAEFTQLFGGCSVVDGIHTWRTRTTSASIGPRHLVV